MEQPSNLSMGQELEQQPANMYKFKSNIRQRFDMQDTVEPPDKKARHLCEGLEEDLSLLRGDQEVEDRKVKRDTSPHGGPGSFKGDKFEPLPLLSRPSHSSHGRDRSDIFLNPLPEVKISTSPSPFQRPVPSPTFPHPPPQTVPIFALNTKGSFYVPLSIDLALLAPFLHLFSEPPPGPLHPITISVNFRPPSVLPQVPPSSLVSPHSDGWGDGGRGARHQPGVIQQPSVIKHWRDTP